MPTGSGVKNGHLDPGRFSEIRPTEVPLDETGVEFDEDKIDRIELFYEDSPEATIRATVNRLLSDRDEGMGLV
jgi:hypothetical protein